MGYELRREIRAVLPPGTLTPLERNLVLELAEQCSDKTREGWPGSDLLQLLIDKNERTVETALKSIGQKWVELRVELGKGSDGRPYYSHRGKRTTYRFPPRSTLVAIFEKATGISWASSPWASIPGALPQKAPKNSGASNEKPPTFPQEAPDFSARSPQESRGPSPQGSTPQNFNTSSLSSARTSVPGPRDPADDRERDESTSSEDPKPNTPATAAHRMLAKRGIHGVEAERVVSFIHRNTPTPIKGDGWWYTADGNGSLDGWISKCQAANTTGAPGAAVEPSAPCPLHSRYPLNDCGVCWATLASGGDPYDGREGDRPPGWWDHYNQQGRRQERPNSNAENAYNWLSIPVDSDADLPVMHPQHPRRMINSHANQDRYNVQLKDVLGGAQ